MHILQYTNKMLSCDKHIREMSPDIGARQTEKKGKGEESVERMGADRLDGSREAQREGGAGLIRGMYTETIVKGMNARG